MPHRHVQHASARQEAFCWYHGTPPTPDEARRHFASKAVRDPSRRSLYAEALNIFLATCWKISSPANEEFGDKHA